MALAFGSFGLLIAILKKLQPAEFIQLAAKSFISESTASEDVVKDSLKGTWSLLLKAIRDLVSHEVELVSRLHDIAKAEAKAISPNWLDVCLVNPNGLLEELTRVLLRERVPVLANDFIRSMAALIVIDELMD